VAQKSAVLNNIYLLNRRNFLKAGFLSSAIFIMNSCELSTVITSKNTIDRVQNDLFPKAQELGIKTSEYIEKVVLHHSRITEDEKLFLKNGVKWLHEKALELHKNNYLQLSSSKRQEVLRAFSQTQWGERWMYKMMNYIFEAMLGDPIYGANCDKAGWKWLAFKGGEPRAKEAFL